MLYYMLWPELKLRFSHSQSLMIIKLEWTLVVNIHVCGGVWIECSKPTSSFIIFNR